MHDKTDPRESAIRVPFIRVIVIEGHEMTPMGAERWAAARNPARISAMLQGHHRGRARCLAAVPSRSQRSRIALPNRPRRVEISSRFLRKVHLAVRPRCRDGGKATRVDPSGRPS
jgi:hypothetical protein